MPVQTLKKMFIKTAKKIIPTRQQIFLKKMKREIIFLRSDQKVILNEIKNDSAIIKEAKKVILNIIKDSSNSQTELAKTYLQVANFLVNAGHPDNAQKFYQRSLDLNLNRDVYSLYLQCLLLSPNCDTEKFHKAASHYTTLFFSHSPKYQTFLNDFVPNKILNIGYLCHFFHNSVSQSLLIPFLKAHDRRRVKIFCYSDGKATEVGNDVRNIADVWRDTETLYDEALAKIIHEDKIDILLELNGHCVVNRYGVIAQKPAPIQVSYYNQCATTGVSGIDYNLIGDEIRIDKSQNHFTESIYFIPGVTGIAEFPDDFPECVKPPFIKNGYITFGSFGAAHKVNKETIALWCSVLTRLPDAKFYMKATVLDDTNILDCYRSMFAEQGICHSRIIFEGHSEHRTMLACYSKVDIALDTFPYAAGTTTMEAIWQGVPVITLSGNRYCSQNGQAILSSIGHPELIAQQTQEFIEKAVELAQDKQKIKFYRQCLREDFRHSPRANALAFAAKLDDAYHDMWQRYLKTKSFS